MLCWLLASLTISCIISSTDRTVSLILFISSRSVCILSEPPDASSLAASVRLDISLTELPDLSASLPTSVATTEKPLPCSPARAASIEAFKESIFVCWAISSIKIDIFDISSLLLSIFSTIFIISVASTLP